MPKQQTATAVAQRENFLFTSLAPQNIESTIFILDCFHKFHQSCYSKNLINAETSEEIDVVSKNNTVFSEFLFALYSSALAFKNNNVCFIEEMQQFLNNKDAFEYYDFLVNLKTQLNLNTIEFLDEIPQEDKNIYLDFNEQFNDVIDELLFFVQSLKA